jgi:hypothetical protein
MHGAGVAMRVCRPVDMIVPVPVPVPVRVDVIVSMDVMGVSMFGQWRLGK